MSPRVTRYLVAGLVVSVLGYVTMAYEWLVYGDLRRALYLGGSIAMVGALLHVVIVWPTHLPHAVAWTLWTLVQLAMLSVAVAWAVHASIVGWVIAGAFLLAALLIYSARWRKPNRHKQ